MTIDDVVRESERQGLQQIQFLYVDNGGITRGKVSTIKKLRSHMTGGIGLTRAMQAINMMDELQPVPGAGPVGEIRLVPDPESFRVLPYLPRTGSLMCDMVNLDHKPWALCPRDFLKRQIKAASKLSLRVMATYEDEFSLARRRDDGTLEPLDDTLCFSAKAMVAAHPVIHDIIDALLAQGIEPEQYYPELGHGQHELSVAPTDILVAADNQVRYRQTVAAVALAHGLEASFAPKPWVDQAGNGAHVHFSLWDPEFTHNLFWDAQDPYHLSELGYHFAAGVVHHLPALVGLTCASVNSYRRLNPRSWSSAYTSFGPDNREAAVRIASVFWGNEEGSINLELKASDSSANPYLALGGLLAAGLDGIQNPRPLAAMDVDPSTLTEAERAAAQVTRLPETLAQAMDRLAADRVLTTTMGSHLVEAYLMVKRSEAEHFQLHNVDYELRHHFSKY